MTENLLPGCGIKVLRRERDLLILTRRMRDSFKIDGGMRDGSGETMSFRQDGGIERA